jgi:hypothetical protein
MRDLVYRLRSPTRVWNLHPDDVELAANEIERLRAALDAILRLDAKRDLPDAWEIARDALNPTHHRHPTQRTAIRE